MPSLTRERNVTSMILSESSNLGFDSTKRKGFVRKSYDRLKLVQLGLLLCWPAFQNRSCMERIKSCGS